MKRRIFLGLSGGAIGLAGLTYYIQSDTKNFMRSDTIPNINSMSKMNLMADEKEILFLASLAPSGHNTQPWSIKYIEPYHWIICSDQTKWLSGVDPTQRETVLSIGAFLQNLEFAATNFGYEFQETLLAKSLQDENIIEIRLKRTGNTKNYDLQKLRLRRTVRSNYMAGMIKKADKDFLLKDESAYISYLPNSSKESQWINEQTIEANRLQSYRDPAQRELSEWIRFSSKDAKKYSDGLTMASMEIEGMTAWYLRNFYSKSNVMQKSFREANIDTVKKQVSQSAGWFVITSENNSIGSLIETGKRMERLFLKVRPKNIAIHPMSQILEEASTQKVLNDSLGIAYPVQFLLRTGYLKKYPEPVSLRRSVDTFIHA